MIIIGSVPDIPLFDCEVATIVIDGFEGTEDGPWKLAVEVVVEVKYPQGFEGSVAVVQDVPTIFQFRGCGLVYWLKITEKLMGRSSPTVPMGLSPPLVPTIVKPGQFTAHGPLPPFAHPPSKARLKSTATNASCFIMIEVFICGAAGYRDGYPIRLPDQPGCPVYALFRRSLRANLF